MFSKLRIIYFIYFLKGCYFHAPIVSLFLTSNSIGVGALFYSQVLYALGIFLFEVPLGVLADKYGHDKSIRLGYLLDAFCWLMLALYPTAFMLYVLFFLRGAAGAFKSGSMETVLYGVGRKRYSKNLSNALQFEKLGDVFAVLMASALFGILGVFSFKILIFMAVFTQFFNLFLTFKLPLSRSVKEIETGLHEWQILRSSFYLLKSNFAVRKLLIWSLLAIPFKHILQYSGPLIMNDVDVFDFMIPAVFVLSSGLSIVLLKLVVKFENNNFVVINMVRSAFYIICGLIFVMSSSAVIAYLAFLFMFSIGGVLAPLYSKKISDLASNQNRATVLSMFSMYKFFILVVLRFIAGILGTAFSSILLVCVYTFVGFCFFVWDLKK